MKRYLLGILLIATGAFAVPVLAQDSADLGAASATVYFPNAIVFRVDTTTPVDTLRAATLEIGYPADEPLLVEVLPAGGANPGTGTAESPSYVLHYVWQVPGDNPPAFGTEIAFSWALTTADGDLVTLDGAVPFQDERFTWTSVADPEGRFRLLVPQGEASAEGLLRRISPIAALMARNSNELPRDLQYIVYPAGRLICDPDAEGVPSVTFSVGDELVEQPCDIAAGLESLARGGYTALIDDSTLVPRVTQHMFSRYFPQLLASRVIPQWFRTGLEIVYQAQPPPDAYALAERVARGDLQTLRELEETGDANNARFRTQSYGMLLYLLDQAGLDALFDFARLAPRMTDFDAAFRSAFGYDVDALPRLWRDWLFTQRAFDVYGYTPYAGALYTAVPSATLSPTPTVTNTPIPLVFSSSTPRPTWTPRPPTPTVTPLPAGGFLIVATPIPPQESPAAGLAWPPEVLLSALAVVVVGALAIALAWFGSRPRQEVVDVEEAPELLVVTPQDEPSEPSATLSDQDEPEENVEAVPAEPSEPSAALSDQEEPEENAEAVPGDPSEEDDRER